MDWDLGGFYIHHSDKFSDSSKDFLEVGPTEYRNSINVSSESGNLIVDTIVKQNRKWTSI